MTNEVVGETSGSGHEGSFARGVPRDRRCGEREGQNEIELVLVKALVPFGKVNILLREQRALLLDGRAQSKPFEESGPVIVSARRLGVVSKHPSHSLSNEVGKILEKVSLDRSLVDGLSLA